MESENPPTSIEQWYRRAMALDRNWRESRRKEGTGRRGSEVGVKTELAMTPSVAEEAAAPSAGDNRACSNGRSGEDECGSSERIGTRGQGSSKKGSFCNGGGLG